MTAPRARSPLGLLALTVFLDIVGFALVLPLLPAMLSHYLSLEGERGLLRGILDTLQRASGSQSPANVEALFGTVLMGLYSVLQFLFAPIWGALSDRKGRRPVLLWTIGGITFSYLLWFFSNTFLALLLARCLGGIMSGNISTASAAVADSTTPENRSRGMGLIGAAVGLGFTLGPALGAGLHRIDLAETFPALTPLGIHPFSAAAGGAFLLGLFNWLWVHRRFEETLPPGDRGKPSAGRRTANPVKLLRFSGPPGVRRANAVYFIYFTAFAGMESTLTFLAKDRFQYDSRRIMYMFLFIGLILVFVQGGMIRQLAPVYGEKRLTLAGLLLLVPGFVLTGFAHTDGRLYLGLALMAFGSAFITPSMSALVSLYTPASEQGAVLGVFRSLGALARAVGPFLAGVLYWRFSSPAPYVAAAVLAIGAFLLALGLPAPPGKPAPPVSSSPGPAA
ncbi:MAG TPA: MFS transporter [Planctomycetota bacterium]|nr:MFS transporter [Planctomycetota bacterium]